MAHKHNIVENDPHFEINPHTRAVLYTGEKEELLVQYDHNSERFTFQMPRFVEGHDMLSSDRVEIHFKNLGSRNDEEKDGVYYVDDVAEVPDTDNISFSWLISNEATQFAGTLKFVIRFVCLTDERRVSYSWSTAVCSGKWIGEGMINNDTIEDDYGYMMITNNGFFDVSRYGRIFVAVKGGGEINPIQTLTLVNFEDPSESVSFAMPKGFLFSQFIGSNYDTSDGTFSLSRSTDGSAPVVLYGNNGRLYYSDGSLARDVSEASGTFYYNCEDSTAKQTLTLYNANGSDAVRFIMPKGYTFERFMGSAYDTSGGLFGIKASEEHKFVLCDGSNLFSSIEEWIIVLISEVASGDYYYISASEIPDGMNVLDMKFLIITDVSSGDKVIYMMPEEYTFDQFIGSEYDTSGGALQISDGYVLHSGDYVTYDDRINEKVTASSSAKGKFYSKYFKCPDVLTLIERSSGEEVKFYAPAGYTFKQFIGSIYSGGLFSEKSMYTVIVVAYNGKNIETLAGGIVGTEAKINNTYYY